MNKVVLVGRLTKDPELKRTSNDIAVVQFTIAVSRAFSNRNGEKQTDFINCVVWRQQAENLAKYMRKGSLIGVDGQIQVRNYEDAGGVKRYVTEVICDGVHFLESKSARDGGSGFADVNQYDIPTGANKTSEQAQASKDPFEDLKSSFDVSNDDLPF